MIDTLRNSIAAFLILAVPAWARAAPASLTEIVDRAVRRSPGLEGANAELRRSRSLLLETKLARLPVLSAGASAMRGDGPVYAFSSLLGRRSFTAADFAVDALNRPGYVTDVRGSLELGIPLFTGFRLSRASEMGRISVGRAEAGAEAAAQRARLEAVDASVRLLAAETLAGVLERRIASAAPDLADAERLRKNGLVLGSDYFAAQAVLEGLRAWKSRADSDAAGQRRRLTILLGSDPGPLPGSLELGALPEASEDDLLTGALERRADLRQARSDAAAARVAERGARDGILPRVEGFAALESAGRGLSPDASSRIAGVRAAFPFGDPAYLSRSQSARAMVEAAEAGARASEEAARSELAQAAEGYRGAVAAYPATRRMRDLALQALTLFRPLYKEGRQSVLDVLRAEEAAARAEAARLETAQGALLGYARLMLAAGRLDDAAVADLGRALETRP